MRRDTSPTLLHVDKILTLCNREYSSSNPLKVTILAHYWNRGCSYFISELAKQLAHFPQLKVTVLVPENSGSSEQDRREFQSLYKVTIVETKKQPGFVDPSEWLNFPPANLSTDIVIGYGKKIGKIAQYWKERHKCKSMYIVTDPLYPDGFVHTCTSTSSFEKIREELCEVADICVATGPKMSETLNASLRYQKKRVFELTPGIISNFCDTKHSSMDERKFRVLLVGGDNPDNFQEEGLEITAKAMKELKDKSYHLIYVGAEKAKEQFSEKFQQCGVAKRQLKIRSLPNNDKDWKKLFCESDLAIMPSGKKEFGLEALLALSAGLPVLVHGDSGFGEALSEVTFGTSAIVDSDDATEWATAIKRVKGSKKTRLDEAAKLRSHYNEKYSWEKQCKVLVARMLAVASGMKFNFLRLFICFKHMDIHQYCTIPIQCYSQSQHACRELKNSSSVHYN